MLFTTLACGGNTPAQLADFEIFPEAVPLAEGENTMADLLAESIAESAGTEGVKVDLDLYEIPPGTDWDEVQGFFTGQVKGGDWSLDNELSEDSDAVSTIGWTRGGVPNEQALLVAFADDPFGGSPLIIVMLFSE